MFLSPLWSSLQYQAACRQIEQLKKQITDLHKGEEDLRLQLENLQRENQLLKLKCLLRSKSETVATALPRIENEVGIPCPSRLQSDDEIEDSGDGSKTTHDASMSKSDKKRFAVRLTTLAAADIKKLLQKSVNILRDQKSGAVYKEPIPDFAQAFTQENIDKQEGLNEWTLQEAIYQHEMLRRKGPKSSKIKEDLLELRRYFTRFYIRKHASNREEINDFKRMVNAVLLSEPMLSVFNNEYEKQQAYSVWCLSASKRAVGEDLASDC